MSWLFPAFVPGLLIAATFGLDRLETGLRRRADGVALPDCPHHRCPAVDSRVPSPPDGNPV